MKCPDGRACHLCQFDRPQFCLINRPARSIRGEDRGPSRLDDVGQAEKAFARTTGTRTAHGIEAKHPENPCNELAVEALADQDHSAGPAKIKCAGKNALMPKAVDLRSGLFSLSYRDHAGFAGHVEAPRSANHAEQSPHNARNDGQHDALTNGEFGARFGSHSSKFSCAGCTFVATDLSCTAASGSVPATWRVFRTSGSPRDKAVSRTTIQPRC